MESRRRGTLGASGCERGASSGGRKREREDQPTRNRNENVTRKTVPLYANYKGIIQKNNTAYDAIWHIVGLRRRLKWTKQSGNIFQPLNFSISLGHNWINAADFNSTPFFWTQDRRPPSADTLLSALLILSTNRSLSLRTIISVTGRSRSIRDSLIGVLRSSTHLFSSQKPAPWRGTC